MSTGYIHFESISPGNNLRIIRESGREIITNSIVNYVRDESIIFMICVVIDENRLMDPVNVCNDRELLTHIFISVCLNFSMAII